MYKCKECNAPVLILEGHEPIRSCSHKSTIVMDMNAVASGKSEVSVGKKK